MADERSTHKTHNENPDQALYDESYYHALRGEIKGDVLDIGAGALMYVKRYINNPGVKSVTAIDKFREDYQANKLKLIDWVCPQELPKGEFDTIVSTEFIEHIERDQLEPLLEQICERLTGKFVGSTPNKKVPTTNPYHLYEYTLSELQGILKKYFKKVKIKDTGYNCTVWIAEQPRSR
jgi:2-polyprenyl-3-methyl-5-hydroxy-6-metoxy-1,4-benzoquinol methylase